MNYIERYELLQSYKNCKFEVIQWEVSQKCLREIQKFVKFPFSIEFKEWQTY